MGLFDSNSSNTTNNYSETVSDDSITDLANSVGSNAYDFSFGDISLNGGGGGKNTGGEGGDNGGFNFQMLDGGAISSAFGFANNALATVSSQTDAALNASNLAVSEVSDAITNQGKNAALMTKGVKWAGIAALALIGVYAIKTLKG